jgi:hypothetical protein
LLFCDVGLDASEKASWVEVGMIVITDGDTITDGDVRDGDSTGVRDGADVRDGDGTGVRDDTDVRDGDGTDVRDGDGTDVSGIDVGIAV